MRLKDVLNIGIRTADKLMDQRIINRNPQLGSAHLPCPHVQTLGIDQRSVHVKNDSLDHIDPFIGLGCRKSTARHKLVYNVYIILYFRYIDRNFMT